MTNSTEPDGVSISWPTLIGITLAVFAGIMAIIWYGIPGPDTNYRLEAPSGNYAIEVAERCGEFVCDRVAIFEEIAADGAPVRMKCALRLEGDNPQLVSITPVWAKDETAISIDYINTDGNAGSVTIDFADDCLPEEEN